MSARDDQPATVPPPAGEDDAYSATTKVGAMPAEVMARLKAEGLLPDEEEEEQATKVASLPGPLPPPRLPPPRPQSFDDAVPALHSDAPPPPPPPPQQQPPAAIEDLDESEKTEVADLMHLQIDALRTEETAGVEQMPQQVIPISPSSAYDPNAPPRHPSSARMGTAPVAFPPVAVPPQAPHLPQQGMGMGAIGPSGPPAPPPPTPIAPNLHAASLSTPPGVTSSSAPAGAPNPALFAIDDLSSASLDSKALGRGRLSKKALLGLVLGLMVLLIAGLFIMALMSQRG